MNEREKLRARLRANCCEFHGLGARGLDEHVDGIVRIVEQARARNALAVEREAQRLRRREQDRRRRRRARARAS